MDKPGRVNNDLSTYSRVTQEDCTVMSSNPPEDPEKKPLNLDRREFMKISAAAAVLGGPTLSALLAACAPGSGNATNRGGTLLYAMEISDLPSLDAQTSLSQGSTL